MKRKKIITCASYGGTGSSAITDLLKEFKSVKSLGDYEFAIAHEVDGISDLQHYLIDDWHRLKNDEGIYRFKKLCKNYSKECSYLFNNNFESISNEYIESLINISWQGFWHQHEKRKSKVYTFFIYKLPKKIQFKIATINRKISSKVNKRHRFEYVPYFKRETMYFSVPKDKFFENTKRFFSELMQEVDIDDKYNYIAIDQLVPPTNTNRYIRYFEDIKVIIVDRDPRDLYILNKLFWKEGWIPSDNVDVYIEWFKLMRDHLKSEVIDKEKVLIVKFEDLVFDYENKIKDIMKFIGIDANEHIYKKQYFDPSKSANNTGLWNRYTEFNQDILKIYNELFDFCYDENRR